MAGIKEPAVASVENPQQANKADVAALRGSRPALVVGNARYESWPLCNPENEAHDVSASLLELGFEVIDFRNANSLQLKKALDEYLRKLRASDVGVIYFFAAD